MVFDYYDDCGDDDDGDGDDDTPGCIAEHLLSPEPTPGVLIEVASHHLQVVLLRQVGVVGNP